jgi:hypothetical protein
MKIIKIEYRVNADFVETNKQNINRVMQAMKDNNIQGMHYASYYYGDGNFMHLSSSLTDFSALNNLQEFKDFQTALRLSTPLAPPAAVDLALVGENFNIL